MIYSWELTEHRKDGQRYWLTYTGTPTWIGRLLRLKSRTKLYVGHCTVWHRVFGETGAYRTVRCDSFTEGYFANVWQGLRLNEGSSE